MDAALVRISKFLSYVLRHRPEAAGLTLDAQGWADVDAVLAAAQREGLRLDRALLERVVEENDKQRFSLSPDRATIRANQGHSVAVALGLEALAPPEVLYHGTARRNVASILRTGLHRGKRHHVHLSPDDETALNVGRRHGPPVVFAVAAGRMHAAGACFYRSTNGVWLTEQVPPPFLTVLPS